MPALRNGELKILFFDLENVQRPEHIFHPGQRGKFGRSAGFCADLSTILVFGYKWLGEPAQSIQAPNRKEFKKDPMNDEYILRKAFEVMNEADVVITWYGSGHDLPFLNTRLSQLGLYLDPKIKHIDLYKTARSKMRMSSNSLNAVAKFFGVEEKTKVSMQLWADCWQGNYDSLMTMAAYCRQDCNVLESVYFHIRPFGTLMPHVGKFMGKEPTTSCHLCGGEHLIGNGQRVAGNRRYRRMRCKDCGGSQIGAEIP